MLLQWIRKKEEKEHTLEIRHATAQDLPAIEALYAAARAYMKENGNPNQWGDRYPDEATVADDLARERLYLCTEKGEILGVFCYFFGSDPTYATITEGSWPNDRPYGVIHRIATAAHQRGVASFCFAHCLSLCGNLRIDTHRDNLPMQRALAKNGFVYCGIIHLENGDPRLAYQVVSEAESATTVGV